MWHEIKPLLGNLRCVKVVFSFDRTTPVIQSSDSPAEINETDTVTEADIIEPTAETTLTVSDTVHVSEPIPASGPITSKSSKAPLYLSLKTNMLYDAMLIPSVGCRSIHRQNVERQRQLVVCGGARTAATTSGDSTGAI